jgi:8-amino-7-oxononanoate synthase
MSQAPKLDLLKKPIPLQHPSGSVEDEAEPSDGLEKIPPSFYQFSHFPEYEQLRKHHHLWHKAGLENPFFKLHDRIARDTTTMDGRKLINFSTYSYLGLNGDPRVCAAAAEAARRYGTSASASRLVSGERPPHRELERGLADFLDAEDCITFVSGHTTNVSTLSALLGPKDLVIHDRLIHNSILQGTLASGAHRRSFPHNDVATLDEILTERRRSFEKVLIVVEGIYSMDGDMAPLPELVEVKRRHKALLMVDEAHSIGVVGKTGRGITEHFGIPSSEIDILMGTLSKAFAGCGGYIAGSRALIELLKFTASGFVYSVGMPPPMAAAARAVLDVLICEPNRVRKLQENGRHFLATARALGLDTGYSQGYNIVPIIIGSSITAGRISHALFAEGINVQPIIYPVVKEKSARLRFFLSSEHSFQQIEESLSATAGQVAKYI